MNTLRAGKAKGCLKGMDFDYGTLAMIAHRRFVDNVVDSWKAAATKDHR
jgi:hypothetical protein